MKRLLRRQEGSNLVEMAFAMMVLFPILLGTIEFSLVFYVYHDITDAARVAVRWAAVRGADSCTYTPNLTYCEATSTQIQNYVQSLGYPGLVPSNITVTTAFLQASASTPTTWSTCTLSTGCNARGNQIQVTVHYNYPISIPFWKSVTFPIESQSAMVITQ